jgi:hypothetical protein
MIFQLSGTENEDWDNFQIRNIGFKTARKKFGSVLPLLPDALVRAKAAPEETTYLRLMQKDKRLRAKIIKLGS